MNSLRVSGTIENTSYGIDIMLLTKNIDIDIETSVPEAINILTSIIAYRVYKLVSSNKEIEVGDYEIPTSSTPLEEKHYIGDISEHIAIAWGTLKELCKLKDIEIAKVDFIGENKIKICSFISKEEFQSLVADKLMKEEDTLKYIKL